MINSRLSQIAFNNPKSKIFLLSFCHRKRAEKALVLFYEKKFAIIVQLISDDFAEFWIK